jgi:hypothetical protein
MYTKASEATWNNNSKTWTSTIFVIQIPNKILSLLAKDILKYTVTKIAKRKLRMHG